MSEKSIQTSVPWRDIGQYTQSLTNTCGSANQAIDFLIDAINRKGGLEGKDLHRSRELLAIWRSDLHRTNDLIERYRVK